ncbi:MAG TPA: helix-turn-helix domain-containing protein [Ilumatobacteraceae bacterium]|nr:helix-turn-helix domain-containing protein [Ilumatobacteraceae bacterium]
MDREASKTAGPSGGPTSGVDAPVGTPQLDLLKALGDNTRYAIYLELARSPRPLATADISESLGLHPNTVRPHLERMREAGLLDVEVGGRGDVGRPQHRYSIAAEAPSLGFEPPTMPVLARMVLAMAARLRASADDAEAVGRTEGASRATPYERAPSALEALVSDLDRLGFDPLVTESPDDVDAAVIVFGHCPFADLAAQHPDLVCGLHRGLVAGFVAEMGDAEVDEFCTLTSRTPCRVTVASR